MPLLFVHFGSGATEIIGPRDFDAKCQQRSLNWTLSMSEMRANCQKFTVSYVRNRLKAHSLFGTQFLKDINRQT